MYILLGPTQGNLKVQWKNVNAKMLIKVLMHAIPPKKKITFWSDVVGGGGCLAAKHMFVPLEIKKQNITRK